MYYIYSRSLKAFVSSIYIDAFEFLVETTVDIRFAIECEFSFINWLHQLDAISDYDIMPVSVR